MVSAIQHTISRTAINTALSASPSRSPSAKASLEAQLAQYQRQLSECINCDSAKTLEGKNQIQAISSKIAAIRDNIAQTDKATPGSSSTSTSADGIQSEFAVDSNNPTNDLNRVNATLATAGSVQVTGVNQANIVNASEANTVLPNQHSRPTAANLTLGVRLDIYV
ncbi:hypothetical protein ACO0LB_10310 [Undibacterium sp. SXout7W]|uniref:hypothetical protein n=1 Tax=Undibacterium sp. SXout7W TaxID=3413049 RepID=UPI003BEF723A